MDPIMFALMMLFGFMATEGAVEYILGTLFDKVESLTPYKWALMYASLAAGIFLAFYYSLDMVTLFNIDATPVGTVMTGIVMGRGANFVSEVWQKYIAK